MNLKAVFFASKLKCNFFKESDKGTSFFHALMSQRHKINYISVTQCSNGGITTSLDEVRAEFVRYYSELLGTPKDTIPIDADVLHCGPCLDDRYHDFLLAPVSSDDIKTAPFGIGNDKAHEPILMGTHLSSSRNHGIQFGKIFVRQCVIS